MLFRLHRMKDAPRDHFRWAAHTSGLAIAKPKDYDPDEQVDCSSTYAAWKLLREKGTPLRTGDILEDETGALVIAKYIGFERAQWFVPEPKPAAPESAAAPGPEVPGISIRSVADTSNR